MAHWTHEAEEHLVTMVEERPALYDVTESLYTNKVAKAELWRQIENKLVISEKFLKKRWESLRTQYTRYKKLAPIGTGGAQRTGRQQWILTRLQFLEPHTKKDATHNPTPREPLGAPIDSDTLTDDTSHFNIEVLSSPAHSETWSGTPIEEPCVSEVEPVPCTNMESTIYKSQSTQISFKEEPCPTTHRGSNTSVPPAKRRRKMLEEPASGETANLMRIIGKTLEKLGSREEHDDEISAYCKNIECRMRKLPRDVLPHFEHEVDLCLYKYSVGQSPDDRTPLRCAAGQSGVSPCSPPDSCLDMNNQLGELGKGAGKGGGGGGSVREAGGAFGKREAAEEERYFRQKEKEQLAALRKHHEEEIDHHKKEIERLQREIDRHKGKIRKLKHDD